MTIFLTVLKVIGWILLILLLILLFLIGILLFVPVRYRGKADIHNGITGAGSVSWLLHLLQVRVSFDDGALDAKARILFFRWDLLSSEEEEPDKAKEPEERLEEPDLADEPPEEESFTWEPLEKTEPKNRWKEELEEKNPGLKSSDKAEDTKKRCFSIKDKVADLVQSIKEFFSRMKERWKNTKVTYRKLQRMIEDERNRKAVSHLKKELFFLLKVLCPGKLKLNLQFSAGAPDLTGQVLGICAMFPFGYQNRWSIYPDFEANEAYVSGETEIKGRIYLFHLAAIIIRVVLDKNCRRLYRMKNKYFG